MSRDTTVLPFRQREAIDDPLSELAREGARRMLAQVLIAEADFFVAMWKDLKLPDGRDRVVRHGHGPHRAIQTGFGRRVVPRRHLRMWLLLWWVLPLLTGAARNFATELPELLQPRPARLASRLPTRPQKSDHLS